MKALKKMFMVVFATLLVMSLTIVAYAATTVSAWDTIDDVALPASQSDIELDPVGYAGVYEAFCITIDSISDSKYTAVRAWTENGAGANYSTPYFQIGIGIPSEGDYSTVPNVGANVYLNLDNPVSTTTTPTVSGSWTPN